MVRISGITFYRQDCQVLDIIKNEYPDKDAEFIKKELSNRWKKLSRSEKEKYLEKAREAKRESSEPRNELSEEDIPPPIHSNKKKKEIEIEINSNTCHPLETKISQLRDDIKKIQKLVSERTIERT